ncbi:mechanosensitive ion channel family protein [Microbulbifer agarilyticus]|uniref:mechanosensitive ion channel family protein n=1 Tax=Microbulbifer agarilyticus TaxID=260552 RepID=UPI001C96D0F9|nr:mechanosensitive ion channel family protein [Microbulbifer agarilyticus]MBY6189206.1 mechanosensitive ion channel family protein [Microbulbifer agarilyticus]MBY6212275.1 mechanosensitive ion channel family protein [Microbulbifer agarilyticus]
MESAKAYLRSLVGDDRFWIAEIFFIVLITALASWLVGRFILQLQARAARTVNPWDDALANSINPPASILIWLLGLSVAAARTAATTGSELLTWLADKPRAVGFVVVIAWFGLRFAKEVERNLADPRYMHKPIDATTVRAIGKLVRASIMITAALVIMQRLGYSVSGVLAMGGIGGLAIGFAAKDLLANFFGGLMIYLDRPFKVGDWVRSPDQEIEGTVEDIGWRLTRIRTFDKRPLYIPNGTFTQISVENPSRMLNRRIYETIGIRYEDAHLMETVVGEVRRMLEQHPEIDTNQTLIVNFNSFAPSSLDFFIYTFTKTTEWVRYHEIKQDVLLKILKIIEAQGASCAFPTSTLHISELPELAIADRSAGARGPVGA